MKIGIFYDTETTGLPLFKEPSEHPDQPHIVQLAAILADLDTREIIETMDLIVAPNGWEIPENIAAIHGITTERATEVGVAEGFALEQFLGHHAKASVRIGHNESFDARIIRIALMRYGTQERADIWKEQPAECTVRLTTSLCKLPPTENMKAAGRTNFKTPKLSEAYKIIIGKDLEGGHSAMVDARACMDIYFAVQP